MSTVVIAVEVAEELSSTLFCFVTFPSGWTMTTDKNIHGVLVLSIIVSSQRGAVVNVESGDDPSNDCFLHARLHV